MLSLTAGADYGHTCTFEYRYIQQSTHKKTKNVKPSQTNQVIATARNKANHEVIMYNNKLLNEAS